MTLLDLIHLFKKKILAMIIISILCGLAVFAGSLMLIHESYQATSTIVTTGGITLVKGFADNATSGYDGVKITTTLSTANNSVTVEAEGSNADDCINAANDVMYKVEQGAKEIKTNTSVTWAETAKNNTPKRYVYGIGTAAAVFIVLLIVFALKDAVKRKIYLSDSVQDALGIPCIGTIDSCDDATSCEKLLTKARYVGREDKTPSSNICLVPIGEIDTAKKTYDIFHETCADDKMNVFVIEPLKSNPEELLSARNADTVLLAIQQEQSSFTNVEAIVNELEVMGARPDGYVFETAKNARKKNKESK